MDPRLLEAKKEMPSLSEIDDFWDGTIPVAVAITRSLWSPIIARTAHSEEFLQ